MKTHTPQSIVTSMGRIVETVAWSAPLSAAMVTLLIWLARTLILERLKGSVQHEYNVALEEHKVALKTRADSILEEERASLKIESDMRLELHKSALQTLADSTQQMQRARIEYRSHIEKSQFDMEFSHFRTLWSATCQCVDSTSRLARIWGRAEREEGIKREFAEEADKFFIEALRICHETSPFVPLEIYEQGKNLLRKCKETITAFYETELAEGSEQRRDNGEYDPEEVGRWAIEERKDFQGDWKALGSSIRARLSELVSEPSASSVPQ